MDKVKRILIVSTDKKLRDVLDFCFDGWGYEVHLKESIVGESDFIKKVFPDVIVIDIHQASKTHLDTCRLIKSDFITAAIPVITLINKRQLRSELLSLKQGIDDYLIKPPDPLDLRVRVEMAIRRGQHSYSASPLTGLPGGRNIEEELTDRIRRGTPFSFAHIDIDNFKYFNDAYGYIKGDRAIMQTAHLLYSVVRAMGNKDDFIGHIGGDDFVFISTPARARGLSHELIARFERMMPFHYNHRDRKQGYIVTRDRARTVKNIALMSLSIAIVSRTTSAEFRNIIEVNEKAAEIKRYLKGFGGSKFMEDRRNRRQTDMTSPLIFERSPTQESGYRPLGLILLESGKVKNEQLDEALSMHWRRGIPLGEVLIELGFISRSDLDAALETIETQKGVCNENIGIS